MTLLLAGVKKLFDNVVL